MWPAMLLPYLPFLPNIKDGTTFSMTCSVDFSCEFITSWALLFHMNLIGRSPIRIEFEPITATGGALSLCRWSCLVSLSGYECLGRPNDTDGLPWLGVSGGNLSMLSQSSRFISSHSWSILLIFFEESFIIAGELDLDLKWLEQFLDGSKSSWGIENGGIARVNQWLPMIMNS